MFYIIGTNLKGEDYMREYEGMEIGLEIFLQERKKGRFKYLAFFKKGSNGQRDLCLYSHNAVRHLS